MKLLLLVNHAVFLAVLVLLKIILVLLDCRSCEAGTYQPLPSAGTCAAGKFTTVTAATECIYCTLWFIC
jgi:hypothetical protein